MEIWLDTTDVERVKSASRQGLLAGVTTNPTLVGADSRPLQQIIDELLRAQPGALAVQVTAVSAEAMVKQARRLYAISPRIVIKVPVSSEGLEAIHTLSQDNIPVMATAVFHPHQVLLAATAGAHYAAPYVGAIQEETDQDPFQVLSQMCGLLTRYQFRTKILAAALRTPDQVMRCADLGLAAVTLKADLFSAFTADSPATTKRIERFAIDWKKARPTPLFDSH